jgi:hypothetical protein
MMPPDDCRSHGVPDACQLEPKDSRAPVACRVKSLAQSSKASTSRVIADLIESGLDAREQEKKRFFECADRLSRSRDPEEQKRLKEELARITFGE